MALCQESDDGTAVLWADSSSSSQTSDRKWISTTRSRLRRQLSPAMSCNSVLGISFPFLFIVFLANAVASANTQDDLPDVTAHPGMLFRTSFQNHSFWGLPNLSLTVKAKNSSSLPTWLHFNESSRTLQGIPTLKNMGNTQIVLASRCQNEEISSSNRLSSCQTTSSSFQINVVPFTWSNKYPPAGVTAAPEHSECDSETVVASLILCASTANLDWNRQLELVETMSDFVSIDSLSLHLESSPSNSLKAVEIGFQLMSAGPGSDTDCPLQTSLELMWILPCSMVKHLSDFSKVVQHNVDVGRFHEELGASVVGWYVASSNSLLTRQHRRRRAVDGMRTVVPTATPAIPMPTIVQPGPDGDIISSTPEVGQISSELIPGFESSSLESVFTSSSSSVFVGESLSPLMQTSSFSIVPSLSSQATPPSRVVDAPAIMPTSTLTLEYSFSITEVNSDIFSVTSSVSALDDPHGSILTTPPSIEGTESTMSSSLPPERTTTSVIVDGSESHIESSLPDSYSLIATTSSPTTISVSEIDDFVSPSESEASFASHLFTEDSQFLLSSYSSESLTGTDVSFTSTALLLTDTQSEMSLSLPESEIMTVSDWQIESSSFDSAFVFPSTPLQASSVDFFLSSEATSELITDMYTSSAKTLSSSLSAIMSSETNVGQPESSTPISEATTLSMGISLPQFETPSSVTDIAPTTVMSTPTDSSSVPAATTTTEEDTTTSSPTTDEISVETMSPFFETTTMLRSPNSWPMVENPINLIIGEQGRLLEYKIPRGVFYDIEDGDTRSLTLTLELPNRRKLPPSFWLYLDTTQHEQQTGSPIQMLKGLPLHQDMDIKNVSVSLVATDSGGQYREDPIVLQINESPRTRFTHRFTIRFDYDFQTFMRDRRNIFELMDRIARHFNDSSPHFITVLEVRHGSFIMSWTNNTLSGSVCQKQAIKHLLNRMVKRDGTVRSSFIRRIGSDLHPVEIAYQPMGPCITPSTTSTMTTTVLTSDKEGHGLSIWAHVILPVLIALVVFILILFIIFMCNRRRKQRESILSIEKDTFSNERNPIIFPDEVESDEPVLRPKHPIVLPSDPHPPYYQQREQQAHQQVSGGRSQQPGHSSRHRRNKNDNNDKNTQKARRKHRNGDQIVARHADAVLDRPANCSPEEEESSRASTLTSNQSGSPTKQPPPYWQSQSHPPPYRLPPPYLTDPDPDTAGAGNGESAQVNVQSSLDTFTTTQV